MDLNQTKPKPRPDIVDLTPPERADQDLIKKDDSFPDVKPKKRPESDKYKGRTYDIYSVEIDGRETNVIEFKDGKRMSIPQIQQMFEEHKSASESIPGKKTSQEISKFLEDNNPTKEEFIRHFTAKRLNQGGLTEQMEMFGYTAEGAQQEVDKFVDKDAAPAKDITFKDAAKFVAELTPIIGDAMAAKEVYDELQKDDPNYFLAGALGGAAIIGLIPGIGDAAASAIRAGARKTLDVAKRVEVDPDAVGMMGGNIRLKSKKTLDDFGYIEDNPVTKGYGGSEDWLSGKIKQANKSKNLLDGATTALLGTSKDKPLFLDTDFISSLKGARDEVRKKGEPQYDRLKKTVDKEGFDPNKTILIEVNHKGEAYIVEGNTRAALAKELDIPNIKAEIRYKNGAELVDSPFSPQNILEKSSTGSYQDALAISKKFDFDAEMAALDKAEDAVTWQKNAKAVVKKRGIDLDDKKSPEALELQESTRLLLENKITRDQHLETVDRLKPVKGYDQLPREPSDKALAFALDIGKRTKGLFVLDNKTASKLGVNTSSLKVGDLFNSRLDIPAYLYHDTWIVAGTSPAVKTADNKSVTTYAKAVHFGGDGKPVRFIASQNQSERIGTGVDNKIGYATVSGIVKDLDADAIRAKAAELLDDPEWTQVGFDPRRQGGFYVRAGENKHVPVREASEVIQIGPLVLAKNAKLDMDYTGYNEGGLAMEEQMTMAFMDEGGIIDDDMDVDPVSGNEVPPGSLAEEVRDDIPAQLSEGEYVVPADVVRYYGVKFFEDLRDEAKRGLAQMEADGRIGGEPVPEGGPVNDQELSEQEMAAIREVMGMAEGGTIQNPYLQQQQMYSQPAPQAVGNTIGYSGGGQVQGYQAGNPVVSTPVSSQPDAPSYAQNTFNPMPYGLGFSFMGGQPQQQSPVADNPNVPEIMTLYGPNGEIVTFNMPLSEADAAEVARLKELGYSETKPVTTTPVTGGGGGSSRPPVETDPNKWMENFDYTDMDNLGSQTSDMLNKSKVGGVIGAFMNGTTAAQAAANIIIMEANGADQGEVDRLKSQYQQFIKDSKLSYMPKGLINGDRLAKDIVENNIDVALFEDSTDPFGNRIFKEGTDDFEKFVKKVGPKGKGSKGIADAFTRVKQRTKDRGTTTTGRPPQRPDDLVKTRTDSTGKKAGDVGYESALRKRQADKRKKYQKTQREKMKAFKKGDQKFGKDSAGNIRNFGGRAEGGLMKKGNK